jgi:hypothetical protein
MGEVMASSQMQLRIESVSGSPINDYRIKDGRVEVRSLAPSGSAYAGEKSAWRTLDDSDIQLHHALRTVVWEWLRVRMGDEESTSLRKAA